jgi:hypothetical protein
MPEATSAAPAPAATGAAAPGAAAPTAGAADASLLTNGTQGEGSPAAAGAEGAGAKPGETTPNKDDPGAQVPEKYEFQMPEDVELDSDAAAEFSALAKELKLPAAEAQKVADIAIRMAQRQAEQTAKVVKEWADQSRADKEFGGDNLDANLAVAKKAIAAFGSEELKVLLSTTGLGNHPEFIRFALKAGKAMSDDTFVKGGQPGATNAVSLEKRLYPNMN